METKDIIRDLQRRKYITKRSRDALLLTADEFWSDSEHLHNSILERRRREREEQRV